MIFFDFTPQFDAPYSLGGDVINLCQFILRENLLEKMPYLVAIDPPKSPI